MEIRAEQIGDLVSVVGASVAAVVSFFYGFTRVFMRGRFQKTAADTIELNARMVGEQNALIDDIRNHLSEERRVLEKMLDYHEEHNLKNVEIILILRDLSKRSE